MNLLRQIQYDAISSATPVVDLLRKCKVLGARLGSNEFTQWVERELNGYKQYDDLPAYRKVAGVESRGDFTGWGGRVLKSAPIPPNRLPAAIRESLQTQHLIAALCTYEDLLRQENDGVFRFEWPYDLVASVGESVYEHMNCLYAFKAVPRGALVRVIDAVRNRILDFALDIERENPDAGDAPIGSKPISPEVVKQVFNNHFYGAVGNVATGSADFEQNAELRDVEA